jgi:uncharacterized protein YjbI with pentapeptide repeats
MDGATEPFHPLTRSFSASLLALVLAVWTLPRVLWAGDREVARVVAFGGACTKCELSGRRLAGARFVGADFGGSALVGSDLRATRFVGSSFAGANLSRADLSGSAMVGADFQAANLSGARLRGAMTPGSRFDGASFLNADLQGAVLTGGGFAGADFRGAAMHGTVIAGVDLSRARGLIQAQFDRACGDAQTKPPPRLVVRACSGVRVFIRRSSPGGRARDIMAAGP